MNQKNYNKSVMTAVKALREKDHIKQEVLAMALGIKQPTYSRMEKNGKASPAQLKIIAKELKTTVNTFFDIADKNERIQWQ